MEKKSSSRTLSIVQLVTIVILLLLLIQQILPFFGIAPIGRPLPQLPPGGGKIIQPGGYVRPSDTLPELEGILSGHQRNPCYNAFSCRDL
jgi:hypothetical protein